MTKRGSAGLSIVGGRAEAAVGFLLYPDPLIAAGLGTASEEEARTLFLPLGHDAVAADRLRNDGWTTIAALSDKDDAATLGSTHRLDGDVVSAL